MRSASSEVEKMKQMTQKSNHCSLSLPSRTQPDAPRCRSSPRLAFVNPSVPITGILFATRRTRCGEPVGRPGASPVLFASLLNPVWERNVPATLLRSALTVSTPKKQSFQDKSGKTPEGPTGETPVLRRDYATQRHARGHAAAAAPVRRMPAPMACETFPSHRCHDQ